MVYLSENKDTLAPIGAKKQQVRNKTGFPYTAIAEDSTQKPIAPSVFTKGTDRNALRKIAGDHGTAPTKHSHTDNKGLDTLSHDSRLQPLAGTDKALAFPNANQKTSVRLVEAGDRMGKKNDRKGNVLSS